jgi:hypothetical protein
MTHRPTGHVFALPGFVLFAIVLCAPVGAAETATGLDPRIVDVIGRSKSIATQRLLDEVTREHEKPTPQRLGDPIGEARVCDLAWRDTLLAALQNADFTTPTRAVGQACTCYAEVRVMFGSGKDSATLRFCTLCGEVGVVLGRSRADRFAQAGWFGRGAPSFVRFVRAHYADDAQLMEIVDRAYPLRDR